MQQLGGVLEGIADGYAGVDAEYAMEVGLLAPFLIIVANRMTFPTQTTEQTRHQPLIPPRTLTPSHKEVSPSCQNARTPSPKKNNSNGES